MFWWTPRHSRPHLTKLFPCGEGPDLPINKEYMGSTQASRRREPSLNRAPVRAVKVAIREDMFAGYP